MRMKSWATMAMLIGVLALVTACGGTGEEVVEVSLLQLLPLGEVEVEGEVVHPWAADGGTLVEGWSKAERTPGGERFVWGKGERSVLYLTIPEKKAVRLILRGWPFVYSDRHQTVDLILNGREVGTLDLAPSWEPVDEVVEVPAEVVEAGSNELVLRYGYSRRPSEVYDGSTDDRLLAVAWASIGWSSPQGAPRAHSTGEYEALLLPAGSSASFFVRGKGLERLVTDGVRWWDSGTVSDVGRAAVEVEILTDDLPEVALISRGGVLEVPLPDDRERPLKITLRAPSGKSGSAPSSAGVAVLNPRLVMQAGTAEPEVRESRAPDPQRVTHPNVLVYVVDSLRADHLGCYGYGRSTSPNLDALARDGVLFEDASAQTSWTRPAVVTLLTGLTPQGHGVNSREDRLPEEAVTLPERLSALGYRTGAVITNGNVAATFGTDQGFATFEHLREQDTLEHHQLSDRLNEVAFRWLPEAPPDTPFFLYLHSTDPHYPYTPREPYLQRFGGPDADREKGALRRVIDLITGRLPGDEETRRELVDLYDGEIAFNDHHFGRLMDELKARGLYDSTLVVFVADHGEEFLEHGGWGHGETLYEEQLRVPLVVKLPGSAGRGTLIGERVRQIDLVPTLLDYLGKELPEDLEGRSLLPLITALDDRPEAAPPSTAYLTLDDAGMESIIAYDWKLIHNLQSPSAPRAQFELYDLAEDPAERSDLASTEEAWRGYLRSLYRQTQQARSVEISSTEAEIDDELRQNLKALGYLP